ncbi:hypothetical protein BBP40_001994 [Aspergillus hancockii]|nr:hypothetical protein BBP40_001994 [Aspergillus hancockii]
MKFRHTRMMATGGVIGTGFSFFDPELMVFTGGEMRNPRKNLLIASRRYFGRLVVFYILRTLSMSVTCPSNAAGDANTSRYTSWLVCCVIFLRFRKACRVQGITMPYRSHTQPVAAWICMFLLVILLLCNGFTAFFPVRFTVSGFLTTYLGVPLFWLFILGIGLLLRSGAEVGVDAAVGGRMDVVKEGRGTRNLFGGRFR